MAKSPAESKQIQKRKLEIESEDELFFAFENEKKKLNNNECKQEKQQLDSENKEEQNVKNESNKVTSEEKENASKTLLKNKIKESEKEKEATNLLSPVSKQNKTLVQGKLSFFKTQSPIQKTEKTTDEPMPAPVPARANGEWEIQDFMVDQDWKNLLKDEFNKKYFQEINNAIKDGYKKNINRPPKELVFNAFNSTKLNKIKVVIIGQDPYHDDGQAHGLAFSVPKGVKPPPSLKNIFTELKNDLPDFKTDESCGGCLQKWTTEGVFLLNTFLTVEAHKAGSHSKIGWDIFTDSVIKLISEKNNGCVFLLWGNFAQKKESLIDKKKHHIVKCAHPSPFSVTRFYGSKCFSRANNYLESIGKTPINWSLKA